MKLKVLAAAAAIAYTSSARAEGTRFYNLEGFGSFLDGNPETTAVTEDGLITLPPIARERFSDAAVSFTAATAKGDDVIVAKSGGGLVLAIDKAGKSREIAKLEGGVVTSLLATDDGLFAATGPGAKIHKLDGKGKSTVWYSGEVGYVWAMTEAPGGGLYVATGDPGKVLKIKDGKATELFASEQTHLRSIAFQKGLGIFVGGGERGILFRSADGEKDFRALFDSGHPEITSIVVRDGYAYAAAVSGAEALASDDGDGPRKGKGPTVRSQLVRVGMNGASETLAGSNDEAIFALAVDGSGNVIVATGASGRDDPRGRLYSVAPKNREISMIYQAKSRRITHLVDVGKGTIAAVASAGGRVIQVTGPTAAKGEFFTVAYDAGINSSFGTVQIFGVVPDKTRATVAVRTGQTATPDATWSAWSPEIAYPGGQRADVSNGRFVQMRLTLSSEGKEAPRVNRMRIAYLRQNLRPFVREVVALRKGVALIGVPREEQKSKTVSLAEKASEEMRRGEQSEGSRNQASRARQVEQRGALTVRWVAEDPNGDELKYDLEFRPEGRAEWRTLNKDLDEPFYTVQSAQLPDGHYQFRVRATDEPSNPRGAELEDRRESTSVLIDNSQPRVDSVKVAVDGKKATAKVSVADNVGPIVGAEYAVDGGEFRPMAPTDGVLDGAKEVFEVKLEELDKGPHTFTVRVIDEAENEGFGESSFQVK